MAEVLAANHEGQGSFYNSRKSSPASSSLFLDNSPPLTSSPIPTYTSPPPADHSGQPFSTFSVSSGTSTSDLNSLLSQQATPASSLSSLEVKYGQQQDLEDDFPQFGSYSQPSEPSDSSDDQTASATTDTTASDSPLSTPTVADDTAIKREPSQHVDYLSHDWREEDVWSSWRHIVSQRKVYGQQSRLENAAWRTWVKSKYHLPTVSPETLNWLKESDVTWLYGPLQCAHSHPLTQGDSKPSSRNLSRNVSFIKKPILKKRSMSEVMLQRSISASSLLKQAAASVQAQGRTIKRSHSHERTRSAYVPAINTELSSRDQLDYFTSRVNSGTESPHEYRETRHIRFDDTVEQCIAIDCKMEDEEEEEEELEPETEEHSSSESDEEGLVMMKRTKRPSLRRRGSTASGRGSRTSSHNSRKIIETLPSTTLKYRAETPEIDEAQQQNKLTRTWSAGKLSPSPSQETLRPARPSRNFLLGQEDEEDELDTVDSGWSFGASNPKSSLGASASSSTLSTNRRDSMAVQRARAAGGYAISRDSMDDDEEAMREARSAMSEDEPYGMEGMRRTESGMFMPYEEDEDDVMAAGLFGRISETIDTARDIAHVIWNVGWRK